MKYQLKKNRKDYREYTVVCINCGKKQVKQWPKSMPIPNPSYLGNPSWFSCHIMKDHYYYPESTLENNQ